MFVYICEREGGSECESERVRVSERVSEDRRLACGCMPKIEGVDDPRAPSSPYGEAMVAGHIEMVNARRDQRYTRWRPSPRPLESQRSGSD
jgi:hypothetical protein